MSSTLNVNRGKIDFSRPPFLRFCLIIWCLAYVGCVVILNITHFSTSCVHRVYCILIDELNVFFCVYIFRDVFQITGILLLLINEYIIGFCLNNSLMHLIVRPVVLKRYFLIYIFLLFCKICRFLCK